LVKLNKIYTRGGDKGVTSLGDGQRVKKNSLRIEAYGNIDELNSTIGAAICYLSKEIVSILKQIQNDLFDIGADLCVPKSEKKLVFDGTRVTFLEESLDSLNEGLRQLDSFVLPGGTKGSAFLHVSRTVARRTERSLIDLNDKVMINPDIIKYINRLSDYLFVAARFENKKEGDILWVPNKKDFKG
tara:strand:- start:782 stop:1339 length:558 start_codon:yes stop_codon:yes gene_type:complete